MKLHEMWENTNQKNSEYEHFSRSGCYSQDCDTIILKRLKFGHTQSAFTCPKLTIETLEQGVKYVQS